MKKTLLVLSNDAYMPSSTEPCFNNMKINQTLMNEIKGLGGLNKKQELYIHYMIKKIIGYAELGFIKNTNISTLDISESLWEPCPVTCPKHNRKTCRCMRLVTFQEDYYVSKARSFPEGTVIGAWRENPFPAVKNESYYNWLMNSDLYDEPYFVLDFINQKLKEAYPQLNLWAKATELKLLTIYDLNVHPHSKHY